MESNFGFGKPVDLRFDDAVARVTEVLAQQGFGVLSEIDVAAKLNEKLDAGMRPYKILGACMPPLAHRAVTAVPDIGLLLPCNVLVREDDNGEVVVSFMDPEAVMALVDNPGVATLAADVKARLEKVMDAL